MIIKEITTKSIISKSNLPVCEYAGRELFIGSVTDPYNPLEEVYGRTRTLLTELKGSGAKLSIATKSDLIMRDLGDQCCQTDSRHQEIHPH